MTMLLKYRLFSIGAVAVALLVASAPVFAVNEAPEATHDGTLVSITGDTLVMTNQDGQQHIHKLTADAKLTLDGQACQVADLTPGTRIRVTTQGADNSVASGIEGLDKSQEFATNRHEGKVVSITGDKLVMTSPDGQQHPYTLAANASLTLDGKSCQAADLAPGTRIRVTTQDADNSVASGIEGLDKGPVFLSGRHDGKVVSILGDKLVMTGAEGEEDYSCTLTTDVKVTCDGEIRKSSHLKPGMRIRVTFQSVHPYEATRIEALDQNLEFESI